MSSDEDYNPRQASLSRNRLKRLKQSAKFEKFNAPRSKTLRRNEKIFAPKGSAKNHKIPKLTKPIGNKEQNENEKPVQSSCAFNGEALSDPELYQLYIKFLRDGHFHANPSNSTRVQSKTANLRREKTVGKRGTTATVTSQEKSIDAENNKQPNTHFSSRMADPLICSNPLPNASGSTLHIGFTNEKTTMGNVSNSLMGNLSDKRMEYRKRCLSSGHVRTVNNVETSPKENPLPSLSSSKQTQFSSNTLRINRMSTSKNSQWSYNNGLMENRADPIARDIYRPIANSDQLGYNFSGFLNSRFNNPNTGNENSNITNLSTIPINPNYNYPNFVSTGNTANFYENRQNFGGPLIPNSSAAENSMNANPINNFPENFMNYASPRDGYNPQVGNFHFVNSTSDNVNQNSYDSLISRNNVQAFPNFYGTGNNDQSNNSDPLQNSPLISIPTTMINDTSNSGNRENSWSGNNSSINGYTMMGDNRGNPSNVDNFSGNVEPAYFDENMIYANDNSATTTPYNTIDLTDDL